VVVERGRRSHALTEIDRAETVVVAGAGGFIGGHLVRSLVAAGYRTVRAVDVKPLDEWYQVHDGVENLRRDLSEKSACLDTLDGAVRVYNLAAEMEGMGFIESNKALCMLSVLINTHLLLAARAHGIHRYFFGSSACVYAVQKQNAAEVTPLREEDAYPATPEDGYGWEKLFGERMCRHFTEDFGFETRVGHYHNVYGPNGTWTGGREKAPAAICRKVAEARLGGHHEIEVWGDGEQTRSFTYIDDCLEGADRLMCSGVTEPLNIGSAQLVTINELIDTVERIADVRVKRRYVLDAPLGVRGRNSDNTKIRQQLGRAPSISLEEGLQPTYRWIYDQIAASTGIAASTDARTALTR
jgi:GDP-D-mannose 3', 5'-epimerase